MIGVSEFCKQPFRLTESVCAVAPLGGGGKIYLPPRTVANVLLDGQFWKKDVYSFSVYSFSLRIKYLFRLHVHPFFIKYHSLVYLTICNSVEVHIIISKVYVM